MGNIAVIGGGIAGLGAAWSLAKSGSNVTLFDKNEDVGGRCRTFKWNGQWVIRGAAAFIQSEENLSNLAKELGIYDQAELQDATDQHSWTIHYRDGSVSLLKDFKASEILLNPKIPKLEKLALARVLPKLLVQMKRNDPRDPASAVWLDDLTACAYFRRYSPTFVDYYLEPIMQMFCGYGEEDYSLAWLIWLMTSRYAWADGWWTFADQGVGRLTRELGAHLSKLPNVTIHSETSVEQLVESQVGVTVTVATQPGPLEFDGAVVAVPGCLVAGLMPQLDVERRAFFEQVQYVGHHIVYMLLDHDQGSESVSRILPTAEGFHCLSNFNLTPHEAGCLFYGEVKGATCAKLHGASDEVIIKEAFADLQQAWPAVAGAKVLDSYLQRNDIALCRRYPGYTRALADFRSLEALRRVEFAGDYLINSTVGQSHFSGMEAARKLLERQASALSESASAVLFTDQLRSA